jgi:microcystin-dependent protein
MADPFVAEIRIFPFTFAPKGWAWCDGQLLPISQNTALFSLLGTTYGGDGKSTFALPDMQGNAPIHTGYAQPGPGLSTYALGETGGSETVSLLESEMPLHSHGLVGVDDNGTFKTPANMFFSGGNAMYLTPAAVNTNLSDQVLAPAGGDQPHNNMQPYLTLYYNIAMQGVFPPRP